MQTNARILWKFQLSALVVAGIVFVYYFWSIPLNKLLIWPCDDSFYYFKTALNWARFGMPSFDGINVTNGVQPLWFLVITPIFIIFNDLIFPIRAILTINVLFWCLSLFFAYILVRKHTQSNFIAVFSLIPLLYPQFIGLMMSGMETSIAVLSMLVLFYAAPRDFSLANTSIKQSVFIGLAAALVFLARLDSLFLLLAFYGFLLTSNVFLLNRKRGIRLLITMLIPFLSALSYALINYYFFDHRFSPISGFVKSDFSQNRFYDFEMWRNVFHVSWEGMLPDTGLSLYLYPLLISAVVSLLKWREATSSLISLIRILTLGYFLQLLSYQMYLRWRGPSEWWFVSSVPLWILLLALMPIAFKSFIKRYPIVSSQLNSSVAQTTLLSICSLLFLIGLATWLFFTTPASISNNMHVTKYDIAKRIDSLDGTVFSMGDGAGSLGYFSNKHLVHLEGFVNNFEYQDYLKRGLLEDYFKKYNISYLIAYNESSPLVVNKAYNTFYRVEPSQPAWKGSRGRINVMSKNEVFRYIWKQGNRHVAFIVWKLS